MRPRSVIEKIWDLHVVTPLAADEDLLFIDRTRSGTTVDKGKWIVDLETHQSRDSVPHPAP